ncbi:MAG: PTS sugar transporter subunit IIA [Cytophagales bacterium]|nr:PTS sugar transporter subunit IIA [Cytophagales bacterium]
MTLQQLLAPKHILLGLEIASKKRLFEEIGFLFEQSVGLNRSAVTASLFARERLGSTGLGYGVAIPHGRIKGLKEPQIAALQLKNPIGFDAVDGLPVDFLFALLVPENASQKHLDLLAQIAEILSDEVKRTALKTTTSAQHLIAIVEQSAA